ncbi:MAG: pyridoxamine 5'-phosphate oxidase family protein [Bacteroidetes bacterium]|nr:pyridoxamine 5'-phosphate oxidase family protein [Bacteroidota bacterium]MBK9480738.1 pyridoxamine 5'-phosphate oxidase family protein [Bacteroidota bacterium]
MGKLSTEITTAHKKFIKQQKMFFVATAPLSLDGHINLSPKGLEHLKVLDDNHVAYLDFVGSGNETSAHLRENQRITFMFCSFDKVPNILRLYGKGKVILPHSDEWAHYSTHFPNVPGTRQLIVAHIHHVQNSCGYGVPIYEFKGDRSILFDWINTKGAEGIDKYQQDNNLLSLDALPTHLHQQKKSS